MPQIVVIKDDHSPGDLLSHLLREVGWDVHSRATARTAYKTIKAGRHDLVILDLPACCTDAIWNILTVLHLDTDLRRTPLIVCSPASDDLLAREEWLQQHEVTIVRKPFDLEELHTAIEEMLRRWAYA